jgi:hypothetical protein
MTARRTLPSSHFLMPHPERFDALRAAKRAMTAEHLGRAPRTRHGQRSAASPVPASNVVGVGIGEKHVAGRPTGVLAVKFLVRVKYPLGEVPGAHQLPAHLDGLPVDVEQVGTFHRLTASPPAALASTGSAGSDPTASASLPNPRDRIRPLQPGSSVGFLDPEKLSAMAGTFGLLATDSGGLKRYIISNNHVLADENRLAVGGPILQPGLLDGRNPNDSPIARLTRFVPLSTSEPNAVDCALAELLPGEDVRPDVLYLGAPQGTAPATIDMVVHKFGRTTGYRVGRITSIDTDLSVDYGMGAVTFHGQILIQGLGGEAFSDSGDSGAAVLERSTGKAVGLLFAGSPNHSAASHIDEVLAALDVRLVLP